MPSNNRKTQKRHHKKVGSTYLMNNTKLSTRKNVQRILRNKAFVKGVVRSIIAQQVYSIIMKKLDGKK
jgi:hypothetical protein